MKRRRRRSFITLGALLLVVLLLLLLLPGEITIAIGSWLFIGFTFPLLAGAVLFDAAGVGFEAAFAVCVGVWALFVWFVDDVVCAAFFAFGGGETIGWNRAAVSLSELCSTICFRKSSDIFFTLYLIRFVSTCSISSRMFLITVKRL